jgi:hypothetical protein
MSTPGRIELKIITVSTYRYTHEFSDVNIITFGFNFAPEICRRHNRTEKEIIRTSTVPYSQPNLRKLIISSSRQL